VLSRWKKLAIALAVACVLIAASFAAYILLSNEGTEHMTMAEYYEHPDQGFYEHNGEFREGVSFSIEDRVLGVYTLNLPTLIYDPNQTEVGFDLGTMTTLTLVAFESMETDVVFPGNVSHRFPIGDEVRFKLVAEEYLRPWTDGGNGSYATLVEPAYGLELFDQYFFAWTNNYYTTVHFEEQLVDNSTHLRLEVMEIGDFFPMPFRWENVTAIMCLKLSCQGTLAQPDASLYDVDDNLLGTLDSENQNLSIDSEIEPGQYVLIDYDPGYSGYVFLFRVVINDAWDDFPWAHTTFP
jgi:hypothetical protein